MEEEEGFSLGHFFTECHPAQEVGAAGATGGPGAYVLAEGEVGSTQVPWHGGYARGPTAHPFTPASFQSLSACSPILRPFVLALLCEKSTPPALMYRPRILDRVWPALPWLLLYVCLGFGGRVHVPTSWVSVCTLLRRPQTRGRAWTPLIPWTLSPSRKVIVWRYTTTQAFVADLLQSEWWVGVGFTHGAPGRAVRPTPRGCVAVLHPGAHTCALRHSLFAPRQALLCASLCGGGSRAEAQEEGHHQAAGLPPVVPGCL